MAIRIRSNRDNDSGQRRSNRCPDSRSGWSHIETSPASSHSQSRIQVNRGSWEGFSSVVESSIMPEPFDFIARRVCCVCGQRTLVPTPIWPDGIQRNACWGDCLEVARERILERQGQELCDSIDQKNEDSRCRESQEDRPQ